LLIIFDLDDTLIDTSGCITPIKLEDAMHQMIEKGLFISDVDQALEELKRIDATSSSAKDAIAEFLEIHNADREFLHIAVKEIYENLSAQLPVFSFEGVVEGLKILAEVHHLALVTKGQREQQLAKLKNAGIDFRIFSKIAVCGEEGKGLHYNRVMEELGFEPLDVVVCGDRVAKDLTPAKELGAKTIHMLKGRGKRQSDLTGDVDYRVNEFHEILEIIGSLVNF
jgi:putative hydrolase of the HAD superfamily